MLARERVRAGKQVLAGEPALVARQQFVGLARDRGSLCAPLSSWSARSEESAPAVREPPFSTHTTNDNSRARAAGREDPGWALHRRPRQWPATQIRDIRS